MLKPGAEFIYRREVLSFLMFSSTVGNFVTFVFLPFGFNEFHDKFQKCKT